jgi:hypothetical protein
LPTVAGSLDFTGFGAGTVGNTAITIYGSLTISAAATYTAGSNAWSLKSTSPTTRTITSNALTLDFPITLDGYGGTFMLGGNLTLGVTRQFTVTNGSFTCVNGASNYILSTGTFGIAAPTIVNMGSGTHLITGTGTVVSAAAGAKFISTGTLKITDSSNSAANFAGGNLNYNNVWYSRGTSTASNTITGNNSFNDFKDDGSVAHSILFSAGTQQNLNTFTVSGSAGQLITINSDTTGTHILNKMTSGTISRDYLNIQHSIALPAGKWLAGANSVNNQATGTAGSGWNFPRFWVGGTGNWDASTATNWSATSGGAGGATAPTIYDDVTFDSSSNATAYTCTLTTASNCYNLNIANPASGALTMDGSAALTINGSLTITSAITRTFTGAVTWGTTSSSLGNTITMNGIAWATGNHSFNSANGGWTLQDAFSTTAANITLSTGYLNTNGQTVTCGTFTFSSSSVRTLILGASTINCATWTAATPTLYTFSGAS